MVSKMSKFKWLLPFLFAANVFAQLGYVPRPVAGFTYSGGSWIAAATAATGSPLNYVPDPVAIYCYNSGTGKWVPADSSCFGGGSSISLTTNGSSGAATLVAGVLNIPIYSGGSMTWPTGGAGIPNYNGSSAWGTSYNASNTIPANFISTLNQNTTGYAAGLAGGAVGSAPYQSAANTTLFIASPTTNGHTFVYSWAPTGSAIAPTALDLATYLASPSAIGGTAPAAGQFTSVTIPADGVHPGQLALVGNTTLPALPANTTQILGAPSATPTAYSIQMPSTIPTNLHAFYCAVTGTNCLWTDTGYAYNAIPIADIGSAGLSGSGGISIASTGAMSLSGIPLSAHANQAADTVVMNATSGSTAPTAVAMPTCTTGANLYNTSTHAWSCVSAGGLPSAAINTVAVGPADVPGGASATMTAVASPSPLYTVDPRKWIYVFDDFIGPTLTYAYGAYYYNDQCNATTSVVVTGAYGVSQCATSGVSGNSAYFKGGSAANNPLIALNATTGDIIIRVALQQTATSTFFVGMSTANNPGEGASGFIGIAYDTAVSDTGWMCVGNNAGTKIRTAVAGTLDTNFHDLRIRLTNGGFSCSVDGGTETAIASTYTPTVVLLPMFSLKTDTASIESFQVDYFYESIAWAR
jgi:hypothetical protein